MNRLDKIIVNVSAFIILFFVSLVIVKNIIGALFIGFLLCVTANSVIRHLFHRRKLTKMMTVNEMEEAFALMGSEQNEFFLNSVPPCFEPKIKQGYIELTVNCEKILLFPSYKFSPCGMEDIAKFYRICATQGVNKAVVLGKLTPRSVILFASKLDIEFLFENSRKVCKFLYAHNALPEKISEKKRKKNSAKIKRKFSEKAKLAFADILVKKRAKYFLLAGVSCAILGVFTPLKIYYCIVSVIALLLSVACFVRERI